MLTGDRVKAAVVVNPNAGAVRRDSSLVARMKDAAGDRAEVLVTRDTGHLVEVTRDLAARKIELVGVVGGDGTASATLTALARSYGDAPLPALCLLGGGTQDTIAHSLGGHRAAVPRLVRGLFAELGSPAQHCTERPTLRVDDRLGFLFGTGVMAGYLDVYNNSNGGHPTPLTAVRVLVHAAASAMINGPKIRSILNATELEVDYEGGHYETRRYVTIGAATVPHLGLGFRLFFRAFEAPDAFHLLAVHGSNAGVASELPRVFAGRGLSDKVARQTLTNRAVLKCAQGPFSYFVDGDLYLAPGTLTVGLGPRWTFLHPKPI